MSTSVISRDGVKERFFAGTRPGFFIVGAPKSGTTAMAHYLGSHPDLYLPQKEMHVFGADLRFGAHFYRRSLEAYLAEFNDHRGRLAGDASVWYLFSTRAAAEIKAFNPDSRIIIMLRDPTEMVYSLYYQFRFDGNEDLPTFVEALEAEADRRAGRRVSRQAYLAQGLDYHAVAHYAEQARRYFEAFGREKVHVIIYDDIVADAASVCRATLDFLGVDPPPAGAIGFEVINGNKTARHSALLALVREPLVRSAALAVRPWLPRPVFNGLRHFESRVRQSVVRAGKRPPLDPELRARLKREFAPEVESLSQLLGRDLTGWSK